MSLKSLQIPDGLADMGAWLDELIVSHDLVDTIVELEVLAGDRLTKVQSLDGVLAGSEEAVLESGLAGASEMTLRGLLRQPSLLLELQELVMMQGGDFWQQKIDTIFGRPKMNSILDSASAEAAANADPASQTMATSQSHRVSGSAAGKGKQKMILGVLATLAAAVLVMFSIGQFGGSGSSVAKAEWGFTKSGLLESDISEAEMLDQLAAASAAWYNKTPTTPAGLAKRLRQFDLGCETLLSSRLTQLSPSNRSAVHAACEDCREAIARQLVAIANGGKLAQIQSASDTAIDALTRSIKRLS